MPRIARAEVVSTERRRRRPGTLNRLFTSNLEVPEECKDPAYHYCWIKNSRGRVQAVTTRDDYETVTFDMLEDEARKNRSDYKINRDGYIANGTLVTQYGNSDGTNLVLCRKPLRFVEADYEEALEARQAMMEARVYEGELDAVSADGRRETLDSAAAYIPKGNTLGDTAPRRRGPIPRRLK